MTGSSAFRIPGPVWVTGASGTLGRGVAANLIRHRVPVALHAVQRPERLDPLVRNAHTLGVPVTTLIGPLDTRDLCADHLERITADLGPLQGLALCHGTALIDLFQTHTPETLDSCYRANLASVAAILQAAIPGFVRQQHGRVAVLSSMWGVTGASMEAWYSAQKAGIHALVRSLAQELGPSGIRLNAVAAGYIDSPMNAHLSPEDRTAFAEATPVGRLGTAEDIVPWMLMLLSDFADFMTGQILTVDGGYTL